MTKNQRQVASTGNTQKVYRAISHEHISFEMVLPPGTALADFFITAKEVMDQLKVGKRKLANMRRDGEISYTYFGQTIMYLKQELAAMLKARIVIGRKSIMRNLKADVLKNVAGCYWLFLMLSDNCATG